MSIDSLLQTHTVTIKAVTPVMSGTQVTTPFVNRSTGNAARIAPLSGNQVASILGRFPTSTHMLFVKSDVTINAGDRVINEATSETYEVESAPGSFFDVAAAHHRECVLRLIAQAP